jgi:uridine kinase
MNSAAQSRLVAIVGGSGAGKSWLADRFQMLLGETSARLSLDDFYLDRSHLPPSQREQINFDDPAAIDWPYVEKVLRNCRNGRLLQLPLYDFTTHTRVRETQVQQPRPLILMDGLWLLHRPAVRRMFDLSIFINSPARTRLRRRMGRDIAERGRTRVSVRRQFEATVSPMHRRYVQPQLRWADVVLTQPYKDAVVGNLADQFWGMLKAGDILPAWMRETFRAELLSLMKQSPDHD